MNIIARRKAISLTIIILLLFLTAKSLHSNRDKKIIIEDFEGYKNNLFKAWQLRDASEKEAARIYTIKSEDDNRYLNAETEGGSVQIAKKTTWNLKKYPFLSWRWRVRMVPRGGRENAKGKNDSAAAIYVIFQREKIPFLSWKYQPVNVIKYIWSSTLPINKVVRKSKTRLGTTIYEGRFLVLRSGVKDINKWITEKRNVLKDYKSLYGSYPEYAPLLIAILTDSNDTDSAASADYDDIIITSTASE